jgi:hypothetical protein
MEAIQKKYILDEKENKVAVQLDIATFNKIEEVLENYALYNLILENENSDTLDLSQARQFYDNLEKFP